MNYLNKVYKVESVHSNTFGFDLELVTLDDGRLVIPHEKFCLGLGYKRPRNALRHVPAGERFLVKIQTAGGPQDSVCLSESGSYHVLLKSKSKLKNDIMLWMAVKVMPEIRSRGFYAANGVVEKLVYNPKLIRGLLDQLDKQQELLEKYKAIEYHPPEVQKQLALLPPQSIVPPGMKAQSKPGRRLQDCVSLTLITVHALSMKTKGYYITIQGLFRFMRENGYLYKAPTGQHRHNLPSSWAIDQQLLTFEEPIHESASRPGRYHKTIQPFLTELGREHVTNRFRSLHGYGAGAGYDKEEEDPE